MAIVFIRAIILYIIVMFSMRMMGKRQLGELQPTELAMTILISNIATLAIEDRDISLIFAIIPILSLVAFELILSSASLKSKALRDFIWGHPVIIISNGEIHREEMKKLRLTVDDLMLALRSNNIFNIEDVEYAVVETNGKINILQKFDAQSITPKMLNIQGTDPSPPVVVISDSRVIKKSLEFYKLGMGWLEKVLESNNTCLEEIFLMTVDRDAKYYIVKK